MDHRRRWIMEYPHLFVVRLIGQGPALGIYVGFDEEEAKEEIATATGWPFDGVAVEDRGSIGQVPMLILL